MLTFSEYHNLVLLGFDALQEKFDEAKSYASQQYKMAIERETKPQEVAQPAPQAAQTTETQEEVQTSKKPRATAKKEN